MLFDFLNILLDHGDGANPGVESTEDNRSKDETQPTGTDEVESTGPDDQNPQKNLETQPNQGSTDENPEPGESTDPTTQAEAEETPANADTKPSETDEESPDEGGSEEPDKNQETPKTFTLEEVREIVKTELASFKEELINGGAFTNSSNPPASIAELKPGNSYFE